MSNVDVNDHLVLVCGKSATGKSGSLKDIERPEGVLYLNCENGKKLPFNAPFRQHTITDPYQVHEGFAYAETQPDIHTIAIDSLTYLMDMFESQYIYQSANSMKAWGDFAQFYKKLMQQYVAASTKNVFFLAHTADALNEAEMVNETFVPVKGALKNQGIESYFSCVIAAKKMPLKALEDYKNPRLTITEDDEMLGFKYVFQTRLTKATVNERLRAPMGMWSVAETFIDNNLQLVIDKLHEYYGTAPSAPATPATSTTAPAAASVTADSA